MHVTDHDNFSELDSISEDFPEDFFKMKILPELLKSVEFGGGGPKALNSVIKIGAKLTDDEYASRLTPVIVRLFANPDRAIRVSLLDNLPLMIDRLPQKLVTDKIFPQMVIPNIVFFGWFHLADQKIDVRIYRRCSCSPRTDRQSRLDDHWEAV